MSWSSMDPGLARMALRQVGVGESYALVAFVEGYALAIAGLGVRLAPTVIARQAIKSVLDGRRPWQPGARTFPAHLCAVAHEDMADRLRVEARARLLVGGDEQIDRVRLNVAQVGDLTGVAAWALAAAELMPFLRIGDVALQREAVALSDELRARLRAIAPAEDCAPELDERAPAVPVPGARIAAAVVVTVPSPTVDDPTAPRRAPLQLVRPADDKTPKGKK